jgi:hypothetical protein
LAAKHPIRPPRGALSCAAVAVVVSLSLPGAAAQAQQGPVFELQAGFSIFDFVSVPGGTVTNSAFVLRFATRFPTKLSWLTPVVGAAFLPYGSTQNTVRNTDAPTLFAGNIFSVLHERKTSGWFAVEVPLLIAHSPGAASSGDARDYGRDLVVIPTVYFRLGQRALRELGTVWSNLSVIGQLEQNLTPNKDYSFNRYFFNPIATIGLSFTVGAP